MTVIPDTLDDRINFALYHASLWAADPTGIGLNAPEVAALQTAADDAQAKRSAALGARDAARSATLDQNSADTSMTGLLSTAIKKIKAFAAAQSDPDSVYALAEIPAPKDPAPLGPPETPTDAVASLNNVGEIAVSWKGELKGGTYFTIERQTTGADGTAGAWTLLDTVQEKTFTDTQVPVGFAVIGYRIRARRGGEPSPSAVTVTVPFGNVPIATGGEEAGGETGLALAA